MLRKDLPKSCLENNFAFIFMNNATKYQLTVQQ